MSSTQATIQVYPSPIPDGDYLAVLTYPTDELPRPKSPDDDDNNEGEGKPVCQLKPKTIFILDTSGSMGNHGRGMLNSVYPALFNHWNYDKDDEIEVITFASSSQHHTYKVHQFGTLPMPHSGCTYFATVFPFLTKLLKSYSAGTHVRIVTLSDGDVHDTNDVLKCSNELNSSLKNQIDGMPLLNIESHAIRFFTSTSQPDTRALASVLQFNTSAVVPTLVDVPYDIAASVKGYAETIDLIQNEVKISTLTGAYLALPNVDLTVENIDPSDMIFKTQAWDQASASLHLGSKSTLFWLSKTAFDPEKHTTFTISGVETVPVTMMNNLSQDVYENLIRSRVQYYMMMIKLYRVVGSADSLVHIKRISDYFIELEDRIYAESDSLVVVEEEHDIANLYSLQQRLSALQTQYRKQNSRLSQLMKEIANMDAKTTFNSAQAASFLRSTGTGAAANSAASRGLVRRAGDKLDFDTIIQTDVKTMATHLHELEAKITPRMEENFKQSFVSLGTTMDGIRAVCSLALTDKSGDPIDIKNIHTTESILNTLSGFEILTYLNLVGIPVQATIGDYPDPYRYNVQNFFSGHYCSLSDLMVQHMLKESSANSNQITAISIPGFKGEQGRIDNVIPLFESIHIFAFLYEHASSILNLYMSVGMRRVLAEIPGTLPATLAAALLKMMKVVVVDQSSVNISALTSIYDSLQRCSSYSYNIGRFAELMNVVAHVKNRTNGVVSYKKSVPKMEAVAVDDAKSAAPETTPETDSESATAEAEITETTETTETTIAQPEQVSSPVTTTPSPVFVPIPQINPRGYKPTDEMSFMPQISSPLTMLILPLLQLYIFADQGDYPKNFIHNVFTASQFDKIEDEEEKVQSGPCFTRPQRGRSTRSTPQRGRPTRSTPQRGKPTSKSKKTSPDSPSSGRHTPSPQDLKAGLPTVLRSIYFNEAWSILRSKYRNTSNQPKIIKKAIYNLIGFDSQWVPDLTNVDTGIENIPQRDEDINIKDILPLSVQNHPQFITSKVFIKQQYKLTRLNILTALPFFAKLLNASLDHDKTAFNELVPNIPKVLSTPETPSLLQKQAEMKAIRQLVKAAEVAQAAVVADADGENIPEVVQNDIIPVVVDEVGVVDDDSDDDDDDEDNDDDDDDENQFIDFGDDEDDHVELDAAELVAKKQELSEYYGKRKTIQYNVNSNLESLWPTVFFGVEDLPVDGDIASNQFIRMTKLQALLSAYLYPQPSDRFPTGVYDHEVKFTPKSPKLTTMIDFDFNSMNFKTNPLLKHLNAYQTQCYKQLYRSALYKESNSAINTAFTEYYNQLLTADNIDQFIDLLKNGYKLQSSEEEEEESSNNPTVSFKKGFQDAKFATFWTSLTNPKIEVPLRLEKLEIIILGHEHGDIDKHVWNDGRILYQYPLKPAVQFFHDADQRSLWIDITAEYKQRRVRWDYRISDLPNRHTHHLTHPSFWSLGYTNLDEFKTAVGKEEFAAYKSKHSKCCGFAKFTQPRKPARPSAATAKVKGKKPAPRRP